MRHLLLLSIVVFSGSLVFAQTPDDPKDIAADINARREGLYVDPHWQPSHKERKLSKREKELLFPSKALLAEFKPLLQLSGGNLARLFPNEKYPTAVGLLGARSYYSFHRKTSLNEIDNIDASIYLKNSKFAAVLSGADIGFMINLGEVSLEDATLTLPSLRYLLEYQPPEVESEARQEKLQLLQKGVSANGFLYNRDVVAQLNKTYALRYVSFGSFDHVVIFRTLRQLDDGSYIIAWKFIKKNSIPRFKRPR